MYKGTQPAKLWSIGPMCSVTKDCRRRYRQFVQLDIEALGAQDAYVDLEVIDFSMELYRRLGLSNLQVVLNSVGCPEVPACYRKASQEFLKGRFDDLCDTCKSRYDRNPLRSWNAKPDMQRDN